MLQLNINNSIWNLIYVKKGNYFPDNKTKIYTSGMWLCKEGYSWRFSIYAGKDMNKAMVYYGKYKIKDIN